MGCLKRILAGIGCLVVLVVVVAAGYLYRDRFAHLYRKLRGIPEAPPAVYAPPAAGGAARAESALVRLARREGPPYVDIGAGELAAFLDRELAQAPGRVFDSVAVALGDRRVLVKGTLDVSALPQRLLGPLSEGLGRHELLAAGGVLAAGADGRLWWTIDQLQVRDFPFPRSVIPAVIRSFHIPGAREAAVPVPIPSRVSDVRVSAASVRLYRAGAR